MLSFFEMFHLVEADWRDRYGLPPDPANRTPGPLAGRTNRAVDPQSLIGQKDHKNITKNLSPRGLEVRTGRDMHGNVTEPINKTDAELNRNARRIAQTGREKEAGYFDPVEYLRGGRQRSDGSLPNPNPDFFASKVLGAILGNPLFLRGGSFNLQNIMTNLNFRPTPENIEKIKSALQVIAQVPNSPLSITSQVGRMGKEQVYVLKPQGRISNPDEDRQVLGPRQINPAVQGARNIRVGTPQKPTQPAPTKPTAIDRSPMPIQGLERAFGNMVNYLDSGDGNITKGRQFYLQLMDAVKETQQFIQQVKQSNEFPAEQVQKWEDDMKHVLSYLKDENIGGDFGLAREWAREWKYFEA